MKKQRLARVSCVVLAVVLLISALAGCGKGAGKRGDENQTDFLVMGSMSILSQGYEGNEVLNAMAEEAGVTIEWDTMASGLSEQVNIRIQGMDYPDAFLGIGFSQVDIFNHGTNEVFIDLTPYITPEIMPNLSAILEKHPEIRAAITMSDGKIYGLPSAEQMGTAAIGAEEDYSIYTIPQFSMINKKWLDACGLPVPTTLDELHDALVAFKENDCATMYGNAAGNTIPMSTGFDQWCWGQNIFYAGFGFTNWPNDVCNDLVLREDGKVDFVCDNDNYREAINYFSKWFSEGLMDITMFSQNDKDLIAKCQQGRVGVATWWYIDEIMGDKASDYVFLPVLDGPDGTHNVTVRDGGAVTSGNLNITSACGNPAGLLKFFDKWYAGENVMQLFYGPIGTYFLEKDANGLWVSVTDEQAREKFGKSAGELKGLHEVYGPRLILSEYYKEVFNLEPRAVQRLKDLQWWVEDSGASLTTYPIDCVFTPEELEVIDKYKAEFESAVAEKETDWIRNGGPTDAEWNEYLDMLKSACGIDRLLATYQAAYDRYKAALNK